MKLFILSIFTWAMITSPVFSQKEISPSIRAYTNSLSTPVKNIMGIAGFDLTSIQNNEPAHEIESRSAELPLDSTKTFGHYTTTDSIPVQREIYFYPEDHVEVIITFQYANGQWHVLNRTTLLSDALGRNTDIIAQVYDAGLQTYLPESRIQVFPYKNSSELVDSFIVSIWSVELNDWKRELTVSNKFDAADRLIESRTSIEFFEIPIVFADRYTYNPSGQVTLIESFHIDGNDEFPAGKEEFIYQDNQLASSTTYVSDGNGGFLPEAKIAYTYTSNGQQENINSFLFDFEKNDWKLWRVDAYGYDAEGRVVLAELITEDSQGIWTRSKTTYAFIQDDNLVAEINYIYDNTAEDWLVNEKKFYYYDELTATDPDPVVADAFFLYPNPTSGVVQIKLVGKISVHVYSLSGQLLKNFYMAPGEKMIDLSAFPAGVYQVRAKSDEDYYSGKLIIQ